MTREEQIKQASLAYTEVNCPKAIGGDYFRDKINQINTNHDFIEGAKWADENQPSSWINIDDFLPKINNNGYSDTVLVIDKNNNIELAIYSFYRQDWIRADVKDNIDDSIIQNDITHWMIIPKLLK